MSLIVQLLADSRPEFVKRGLQALCALLQSRRTWATHRLPELLSALSRHKYSTAVHVRRWLYKSYALLREPGVVPYLVGQLQGHETDKENRTWVTSAICATLDAGAAEAALWRGGVSLQEVPHLLASAFNTRAPLEARLLRRAIDHEDGLSAKWVSLLVGTRGRNRSARLVPEVSDVLRIMNTHSLPEVAEYSVWAMHETPGATIIDCDIAPQDVPAMPANVRRWYYRLLAKDPKHIYANMDMVAAGVKDPSRSARDGLALGLCWVRPDSTLAKLIVAWFLAEDEPLVRMSLLQHLRRFAVDRSEYQDLLASAERDIVDPALRSLLTHSTPPPIGSISLSLPGVLYMDAVPFIRSHQLHEAFLLGVDMVDFSSEDRDVQLQAFQGLLSAFRDEPAVRRLHAQDVVALLTGDGLFVTVLGTENRAVPIDVAMNVRRTYERVYKKQLRFGVHSGHVFVIEMSDGARQIIGNPINWTARVMSAASPNEVLVSRQYFDHVVQPDFGRFRCVFQQVAGLKTKKGEPIDALHVTDP